MPDTSLLLGWVLVFVAAIFVVAVLLVVGLTRPGTSRAGLVAGGLPLALIPTVVASAYVAARLGGVLPGIDGFGPGSPHLAETQAALWQLQRVAWGASAAVCGLGLALSIFRLGAKADAACSARRAALLLLLPLLALAAAAPVAHRVAKGTRASFIVVGSDYQDETARARTDAALAAEGFSTGSGSLGSLARYLSLTTFVGVFGGATAAIVLLGLALPGFILAWRVHFDGVFLALASGLWLLGGGFAVLVAMGLLSPLRFY